MNSKPIIYEDKMKYRDNEFLYDKCVKQYHQLMLSQDKNKEYKNTINELEQDNETKTKVINDLLKRIANLEYEVERLEGALKTYKVVLRANFKEKSDE